MEKKILFVNATYIKKIATFIKAKELGYHVTVVGFDYPDWAKPYIDVFIYSDTYNLDNTVRIVKKTGMKFDGVVTFWDRDVVLCAILAKELGLKGATIKAANMTRNKYQMREALFEKSVPHPKFKKINNKTDLMDIDREFNFPVIIKPIGASASKGVMKAMNIDELIECYQLLLSNATKENDMMFSYNQGVYIVEEFMDGKEYSVEGLIDNGVIHYAGVTEKWVNKHFEEVMHVHPARLSQDMTREALEITTKAIEAMELDNCGFHAEIMYTEDGFKIVEVNGRIAGGFIPTHLIPISRDIDMIEANLKLVMGESFEFVNSLSKSSCVRFLVSEENGVIDEWIGYDKARSSSGVVEIKLDKKIGDSVGVPPVKYHDARIAYVITEGMDQEDALTKAVDSLALLEVRINAG